MTLSAALWAAVGSFAIATAAIVTNPRRRMNRCLAGTATLVAIWFLLLHAMRVYPTNLFVVRAVWMLAGVFPSGLWLLRSLVLDPDVAWTDRLRRCRLCALPALGAAVVALTPWVATKAGTVLVYGQGAHVLANVLLLAFVGITIVTVAEIRDQIGTRRLELQLLVLSGIPAGVGGVMLLVLDLWIPGPAWERFLPLLVLVCFGGLVWSLLTTRLLDARHILTLGAEKAVLVAAVAAFIWGVQQLSAQFLPEWISFGLSIGLGLWFAGEVRPWLQDVSQRKAAAQRVQKAAFAIARKDLRPEAMEDAFCRLLCEWAHSERAIILMASSGRLIGGGLEWTLDAPEIRLLHTLRWVTPERLDRDKPRPHGAELSALLRTHGFGAMIASSGPSLAFVVAIQTPRHHRPYTFPEIGQLLGLESTIESALSRAHYLMKAQHAEQLATVGLLGASIAHEIRNPLVSIKTFVQLLPQHHHDAAFRDKFFRLIGDEVGRIDRLTEQLLDLSAPRVFSVQQVAINLLLSSCIDLIAAKADDKNVNIDTELNAQPDLVYTDPNAVKQVVLNLGFNAIQALERQGGDRRIRLCTRQVANGVEVMVSDNGPGIAPEVRSRLFQPFQSTKSSGFGLGLAICKDILSSLHASITADPPQPGSGATFRIILPCQPPTS